MPARVVHHEIGHAVVALALGLPVYSLDASGDLRTDNGRRALGHVHHGNRTSRRKPACGGVLRPPPWEVFELLRVMAVDVAGHLAERRAVRFDREMAVLGSADDREHLHELVRWTRAHDEDERIEFASFAWRLAHRIIARTSEARTDLEHHMWGYDEFVISDGRFFAGFARRHKLAAVGDAVWRELFDRYGWSWPAPY